MGKLARNSQSASLQLSAGEFACVFLSHLILRVQHFKLSADVCGIVAETGRPGVLTVKAMC